MTTYLVDDRGRLVRVVDRTGFVWADLAWDDDDALASLAVPGARIDGAHVHDALLGDAHAITAGDIAGDGVVTHVSAIDWLRPTEIPAIAAPGRLPPGSGATILNTLAVLARATGTTLRYAGPYPTPALWRSLARSFRTTGTEQAFTADLAARMANLARDPIAIEFSPAPFEALAIACGHVELRDGIERAVIDGVAYERDGSPARLADRAAELWFGDARYATVATFSESGDVLDGPHAIPRCTATVIDTPFPPALVGALAELVAEAVPAPLAHDARAWLADRAIVWADLGARAATFTGGRILLHAALWQHVGPHGMQRLALAIAEALVPVVTHAVIAEIFARGRVAS